MRIVAGTAKGRRLLGPRSEKAIRPTADRVRQTLFDVLGQRCDGLRVLDLFSGTGALGLEAVSRGAARATLVDSAREAQALCSQNATALGFSGVVEVMALPAAKAIEVLGARGARFELVFVDPPYALKVGEEIVAALEERRLVAEAGRVIVEHSMHEALAPELGGLKLEDERRFGETVVSIYRLTDS